MPRLAFDEVAKLLLQNRILCAITPENFCPFLLIVLIWMRNQMLKRTKQSTEFHEQAVFVL